MSAAPKMRLTAEQYLAIERRAAFKSEFYDGEMFAMAGAKYPHNRVKENLAGELYGRLKGGPCESMSSDMRVKVSRTGPYTYPDIVIVCGEPRFEDDEQDTLLNPHVVIEVLSESTEKYDRGKKFRHYKQVASIQEYVLVSQDEPVVERFARQADGSWSVTEVAALDGEFALASVPVRVPMSAIYAGITFSTEENPPAP